MPKQSIKFEKNVCISTGNLVNQTTKFISGILKITLLDDFQFLLPIQENLARRVRKTRNEEGCGLRVLDD